MRSLALFLVVLPALAAEPEYFHWDGKESIAEYAERAGLDPTKTVALGTGVRMEFVLIPAGTFTMGTENPPPVDKRPFVFNLRLGTATCVLGVVVLLVILALIFDRCFREKRPPQVSLAHMLVLALLAGISLLGGLHAQFTLQELKELEAEYEASRSRYGMASDVEKPAHRVTLTQPFYLGKFEVTQEQYQQVLASNPSRFVGVNRPVETVSWNDAQAFCRAVSLKIGSVVRLPTEAEWEWACRAGTRTTYATGDSVADLERAGWYRSNSGVSTHPVGKKAPNAWGAHDMHGNAWEWCADMFETYKPDAVTDPQGPSEGRARVVRGGCWFFRAEYCQSASRDWMAASSHETVLGFRVVLDVKP